METPITKLVITKSELLQLESDLENTKKEILSLIEKREYLISEISKCKNKISKLEILSGQYDTLLNVFERKKLDLLNEMENIISSLE